MKYLKTFESQSSISGDDIIDIFQELFDQYGIKEAVMGGKVIGQQWKSTYITKDNINFNVGMREGSIAITITSVEKKLFTHEFLQFLHKYIYGRIASLGYHIRDRVSLNAQIRGHETGDFIDFQHIVIEVNDDPFNIDSSHYGNWKIYN